MPAAPALAASPISKVDDIACQIAGQVPGADVEGGLDLDAFIDPREQRRQDGFIQLGVVAAQLAVEDLAGCPTIAKHRTVQA